MTKKKWESKQTYPDPKWVRDGADPNLVFNEALAYRIKMEGVPAEHMDSDKLYVCEHCNESNEFFIEKKNPHLFKCTNCSSLIETRGD